MLRALERCLGRLDRLRRLVRDRACVHEPSLSRGSLLLGVAEMARRLSLARLRLLQRRPSVGHVGAATLTPA